MVVFALPGSVAVWACGVPAVVAGVAAAARADVTQQRLTATWCSVPPAVVLGAAYWDDLSKENGYLPYWGLAGICLVVFFVTLCVILGLLRLVASVGGSAP
ncbi:MAG: hypothetical protein WED87_06110 [Dehalococcoidia bacterium]